MARPKTRYTREELIDICERAIVPEEKWRNRDSEKAHVQVGECWALLRAGCEFEVLYCPGGSTSTDHETIWLRTYSQGFNYFEGGWSLDDEDPRDYLRKELHYLPTPKRLDQANGGDWY